MERTPSDWMKPPGTAAKLPSNELNVTPLLSTPRAPISSSFACDVVAVVPELGEVSPPIPVLDLSFGNGDTRSLKEKKEAASLEGPGVGKWTVIVPPARALVTGAEKTRVRIPLLLLV